MKVFKGEVKKNSENAQGSNKETKSGDSPSINNILTDLSSINEEANSFLASMSTIKLMANLEKEEKISIPTIFAKEVDDKTLRAQKQKSMTQFVSKTTPMDNYRKVKLAFDFFQSNIFVDIRTKSTPEREECRPWVLSILLRDFIMIFRFLTHQEFKDSIIKRRENFDSAFN